jgi:hypothetical protein
MRNFFKLFGIIAFVAVIGLSMAACEGDDDDGGGGGSNSSSNPLIGTWSYFTQGQIQKSIIFTDSTYEWKDVNYSGLATYEKGTYTGVTGNSGTLTFQPTQKRDNTGNLVNVSGINAYPYVYVYSLVGNNLVLDAYTYTK